MKPELDFALPTDGVVEIRCRKGPMLARYVYLPNTPLAESPRPYFHPLCSMAGEELTCFRPNDHPWHHGLSFTINQVSGHAFWGGPTYRQPDGYQWRTDHGRQWHVEWHKRCAEQLAHTIEWQTGARETLLREQRVLSFKVLGPAAWQLRWQAELVNVTSRALELGNPFSSEGLDGSHYTGLQFRGARDLLDDHGDAAIGVFGEGGLAGETAVHGTAAKWMEWHAQKDTTLHRVTIRFENHTGPLHWFVRRHNPLAAFPFQYEHDLSLPPTGRLEIDHTLTFTDA
ncbi:DUF6807 family protein [Opitutus terrae]|uniref:Oxidoreductase domain protein n=1 Tax=Opitutus terrae (strain DSM 11246 / JCM 15787 / PB90-1) TaxID=452637 RepID=B1ZY36_OPITP|nr:DUF6807 family protein [Opitutus terrae]ACB76185.1 oxidoreductase domain protein [Opitutus terrae PB90-1]